MANERNADSGWYPALAWELALNLALAEGAHGTIGELVKRIRDRAEAFARAIEAAQ